ncbi:MAG: FAD-dependent oxidoreductase [Dehalococcoidales bacterium]|nr:FAD-dependent oxidoreductase [Dehalococcoidales bacterium]
MPEYSHIFRPLRIGPLTVKNRIEFPPVGPHVATSDGYVSRELIEWARQFARGGAGIVTLGDTSIVAPAGMSHRSHTIHVGNEKSINPLSRFAEMIQRYGAKASIQLNYHSRWSPTEMPADEIRQIPALYAEAAYRCQQAGMDMIMVHGAHGHTLSQFVGRHTNLRTDEYGGSLSGRARLVIQVLDAIRARIGNKLAIEYRISADEMVPNGPAVEEQIEFAALIQEKIDLIHVSAGNLYATETLPWMNQPAYFPRGLNLKYAEQFKKTLRVPVATVGSYNIELAEQVIAANQADVIAMARTLIADPESVNKARTGRDAEIRPCIRCNNCINRAHWFFLPVRCTVNPVIGREAEFFNFPPAAAKKKVVVIGGGPAGMEAAKTAVRRGHSVVLFEKEARLGGTLKMAAAAPFKTDMKRYLEWAEHSTLDCAGLTVRLSTAATKDKLKEEKPDVIIIAAGSTPVIPRLTGIDFSNVAWAGEVELGCVHVGNRVVVAGAGLSGSETALHLAQEGRQVTLIDSLPLEDIETGASVINDMILRSYLKDWKVTTLTGLTLCEIRHDGAVVIDKDAHRSELPCDTVVLALGVQPRSDMVDEIKGLAPDVIVIGDCNHARGNLLNAVTEGFFAAMDI